MDIMKLAAMALAGVFLGAAVLRVFRTPLKLVGRVALNSLLGGAVLLLLRFTAPMTGNSLGLNPLNALVIAVLGAPGLGLLLLLQWLFP